MKQSALLITFIFLTGAINFSFAQEEVKENNDVIYLLDGSKILGKIIYVFNDEYVDIRPVNADKIRVPYQDVKMIQYAKQIESKDRPATIKFPKEKHIPGKKVYHSLSVHKMAGLSSNGDIEKGGGISFSMGHRFSKNVIIGAGLGAYTYVYEVEKILIPFFAEYQYEFLNKSFTPFVNIRGGYSALQPLVNNGSSQKGGLNFSSNLGIRLASRAKGHFNFSLGLNIQKYEETYEVFWLQSAEEYTDKKLYQRFNTSVAINF